MYKSGNGDLITMGPPYWISSICDVLNKGTKIDINNNKLSILFWVSSDTGVQDNSICSIYVNNDTDNAFFNQITDTTLQSNLLTKLNSVTSTFATIDDETSPHKS